MRSSGWRRTASSTYAKIFDTLRVLVERHDQLVSKETLMKEIWGDTFVEENNLTQYIFTLRRALGEKKDGTKFIETVPRRGYRFTAEVRAREIGDFEIEPTAKKDSPQKRAPTAHKTSPEITGEKVYAGNTSPPKHSVERFAVGGFVVLLIALSLGFVINRQWQPESSRTWKEVKLKRLTESGNLFGAVISPDGNSLAYVAIEGKNHSVRLRNILTESEVVTRSA